MDWALAFKSLSPPINFNVIMQIVKGCEIGLARQNMAEHSVSIGAKYLFFLGDDVVVPAHTLKQLIYRMEQQPEIGVIGGVYCSKCDPPAPLVFRGNGSGSYWDWKIGELFECTGLGMDCTLIRVSILERISRPWFKTVDQDSYLDGVNSAESWTEDLFFCNKVLAESNSKIYCDSSIICDHWDISANKKYSLPNGSLPKRQLGVNGKKLLIVGPAIPLADSVLEEYAPVRLGSDEAADYRGHYSNLPFGTDQFDWVIIQDIKNDPSQHFSEWNRVLKSAGGKMSLHFNPLININFVDGLDKFTKNGDYLELVNNV